MSEAIPERGEHDLVLAGINYRLRPSHAAIRAIEKKTERSLLELIQLASRGALTFDQLGVVAAELIRAGATNELDKRVDPERIAELIFEGGVGPALARVQLALIDAATGGRTSTGEAKAAPAMMGGDAGAA